MSFAPLSAFFVAGAQDEVRQRVVQASGDLSGSQAAAAAIAKHTVAGGRGYLAVR
jgi:hypothetical protein